MESDLPDLSSVSNDFLDEIPTKIRRPHNIREPAIQDNIKFNENNELPMPPSKSKEDEKKEFEL